MERENNTGIRILENKEPNPLKVLNRFQLQLYIASPELRSIIDQAMASYAQRNNIPYERVTKDTSIMTKVKNFFQVKK
jgi:soluble P-type ATPase